MFGIGELRRDLERLKAWLVGYGTAPEPEYKHSVLGRVNAMDSWLEKSGVKELVEGREPQYGFYGGCIPGKPPLEKRIELLEAALGIEYELVGAAPAEWIVKKEPKPTKAKKR